MGRPNRKEVATFLQISDDRRGRVLQHLSVMPRGVGAVDFRVKALV
jgi:hypothetical protein